MRDSFGDCEVLRDVKEGKNVERELRVIGALLQKGRYAQQ